ncbi:MAG TPA: hypothetical protein VGM27_17240 [Acidobacteriaceae bacterium]|jgi:hypothetical protein
MDKVPYFHLLNVACSLTVVKNNLLRFYPLSDNVNGAWWQWSASAAMTEKEMQGKIDKYEMALSEILAELWTQAVARGAHREGRLSDEDYR